MGIEFLSEDPLLSKTVNDLLANESLNAYDRNGALMFSGTPGKLATVPDHSDIGSITNREGMTIVRF